jgi:proteic killer suppression protein
MIRSFKHKGLKQFYHHGDARRLPPDKIGRIQELLTMLDGAQTMASMARPAFRLHSLKGALKGYWAVTVRANWRITFRFEDGQVYDVNLLDYH